MSESTLEKYVPTYWNKEGKYQNESEILYDLYIPTMGMADTCLGEALRLINAVYYDLYNNAACNLLFGTGMTQWRYGKDYLVFLKNFIDDKLYSRLYRECKAVFQCYDEDDSFAGNDTGAADLAMDSIVEQLWCKYQEENNADSQQV